MESVKLNVSEKSASDKRTSLFRRGLNYKCKMIYGRDPCVAKDKVCFTLYRLSATATLSFKTLEKIH
jgi:hypothetical protein